MHTIGNKRNAPALVWLHQVTDRVEMRESPERLLPRAAGENDWTSDVGKIRIEAKAPAVSALRRQQPVQDGTRMAPAAVEGAGVSTSAERYLLTRSG